MKLIVNHFDAGDHRGGVRGCFQTGHGLVKGVECWKQRKGKFFDGLEDFHVDVCFGPVSHVLHVLKQTLALRFGLFKFVSQEFGVPGQGGSAQDGAGTRRRATATCRHLVHHLTSFLKGGFHLLLGAGLFGLNQIALGSVDSLPLLIEFFG